MKKIKCCEYRPRTRMEHCIQGKRVESDPTLMVKADPQCERLRDYNQKSPPKMEWFSLNWSIPLILMPIYN